MFKTDPIHELEFQIERLKAKLKMATGDEFIKLHRHLVDCLDHLHRWKTGSDRMIVMRREQMKAARAEKAQTSSSSSSTESGNSSTNSMSQSLAASDQMPSQSSENAETRQVSSASV